MRILQITLRSMLFGKIMTRLTRDHLKILNEKTVLLKATRSFEL